MRKFTWLFAALSFPLMADDAVPLASLQLPSGFSIGIYAENVDDARSLALGEDGTVYVGSRSAGKVHALPDRDRDGRADEVITLVSGLDSPNGIDVHAGDLYIVEHRRVSRIADVAEHLRDKPKARVLYDKLPSESGHGWRYARVGPDGALYVGVGAPCNICKPDPDRFAIILRMDTDGGRSTAFARGVRNSVGFDWHPQTRELWFTDNGRDRLGDDLPADELNRAPKAGLHFGYPYCHAGDIADPDFGKEASCADFVAPARKLSPHAAALGMRFYTGKRFPARYRQGVFLAEHGSWNRSDPIGYRVIFVPFKDGRPNGYEVFADGWRHNGKTHGRPVDVLAMPDGALLVSDDHAGVVYRITYNGDVRDTPKK